MPHDGHGSQGNQAMPQSGLNVQVTVCKTIECDIESSCLRSEESLPPVPALPSRMEEKGDVQPRELTEEEQQIRTLEHQMKQDLDI